MKKSELLELVSQKKDELSSAVSSALDAIKSGIDELEDSSNEELQKKIEEQALEIASLKSDLASKDELLQKANQAAKDLDALIPDA